MAAPSPAISLDGPSPSPGPSLARPGSPVPSRLDPLHQALAASWSSFMAAQQQSRETRMLKDFVEERVKQTSDSLAANWQIELAHHRAVASASNNEFQLKFDNMESDMKALQTLQGILTVLGFEVSKSKTCAAQSVSDLSAKSDATNALLEGTRVSITQVSDLVREQLQLALYRIDYLERKLEDAETAKRKLEDKLVAVQSETRRITRLPSDSAGFLAQIAARRDDLIGLLDKTSLLEAASGQPEGECR
jgi:hypothetical protein